MNNIKKIIDDYELFFSDLLHRMKSVACKIIVI